jgi:predicted phage baseplate assembly protein
MPLEEQLPTIDDRTWQNIVDEIRARIPHYAPEWRPVWNDLNDNDPGITLTQVFAHLAELLLYRMARVPELAYVKFLELIGIELTPAQPARAEITFSVLEDWADASVIVPPRTQVSAVADDGVPLVFETERPLTALALQLRSVQAYDGAQYRDRTAANRDATAGYEPFGATPRPDAALVLGLVYPDAYAGNADLLPALSIDLAVWTLQAPDQPPMRQCSPVPSRSFAPARLQWEGWDGAQWTRLDSLNDETLALTRSGHMLVRVNATVALKRDYLGAYQEIDADGATQPKLFWLRARIVESQYERAPRLSAVRLNTVPALQAQTVHDEILGGTSGERSQQFSFANRPLLAGTARIEIDEGLGPTEWTVVPDFVGSTATDRHVVINRTSGQMLVGDGENGAVPVANATNPDANVIAREYRYGGGKRGNVAAKKLNNVLNPVAGLDAGKTENLFPAAGGRDEELLADAKKRARQALRARDRAVTVEDFELLTREVGGVARAKALPLVHPQFPGTPVPGVVSVIVVPDSDAAAPVPSDAMLRNVCEYLDARRLLTTELFVLAPRYVKVEVRAQVVVRDDADPGTAKEDIEKALQTYLHPLHGGDRGEGWPFGGALRYSKLMQRIFAVDGTDSVPEMVLVVDGEERPECTDVAIEPNALVYSSAHRIDTVALREVEEAN